MVICSKLKKKRGVIYAYKKSLNVIFGFVIFGKCQRAFFLMLQLYLACYF